MAKNVTRSSRARAIDSNTRDSGLNARYDRTVWCCCLTVDHRGPKERFNVAAEHCYGTWCLCQRSNCKSLGQARDAFGQLGIKSTKAKLNESLTRFALEGQSHPRHKADALIVADIVTKSRPAIRSGFGPKDGDTGLMVLGRIQNRCQIEAVDAVSQPPFQRFGLILW